MDPLMVPLFRDLADAIEKTTRPIAKELKRYVQINGQLFIELRPALIFYLGSLRFIRRMRAHCLTVTRPEIASMEERVLEAREMYNANLVLRLSEGDEEWDLSREIVCNDLGMGEAGRILILTGPNQGGKTTFMQAAGLIQVLAQAGLYVPGETARISPVDNIYTHFPLEEKPEMDAGRFGEESRRLGEIFQHVTRSSLVLLNESLSSTSFGESLYLALDVVRILRQIGLRAIYTTHLHELASRVGEINSSTPGDSEVASLVASPIENTQMQVKDIHRNYKVEARPPAGRSYAREIAARYGIGYDQLAELLAKRGILIKDA
jgi:DNA mismatch repair ATPase MutS